MDATEACGHGATPKTPETGGACANPLAIAVAVAITLGVTVYPHALAGPDGAADHWAAMAAFWAMSAGYVSGVGFRPRRPAFRLLFSGWSCLAALAAAGTRMAWLWG
ncbi:cyd operon YbgE family protein [Pseudothauera rhizosphaerae]|uniref:Cyd operon protein YbgE n=1 Tax=Pseudothauera rhizosphaerae TaxID=2565932 RepID=A0A4S4ATT1_9RHOO|nr:cyd operon YbgE family protein [Pseudothauera rhizosphaerae]THF63337.1 hypothetical protein E6O51_04525 [Pseudothauera rhizosphaerae]